MLYFKIKCTFTYVPHCNYKTCYTIMAQTCVKFVQNTCLLNQKTTQGVFYIPRNEYELLLSILVYTYLLFVQQIHLRVSIMAHKISSFMLMPPERMNNNSVASSSNNSIKRVTFGLRSLTWNISEFLIHFHLQFFFFFCFSFSWYQAFNCSNALH